jgi:type IV fimbrial biogenesis protein FimT
MLHRFRITGCTQKHGSPFICPSIPFVGRKFSVIMPSICKKSPLVWNSGFTLIELIITLTIAGILMAVAVPGLKSFVASNRLTTQVNDLIADINLTRSESVKRSTTGGICATAVNGTACAAGGNWANGWLVYYIDPITSATVTVRFHEPLAGNNTVTSAADSIAYRKDGIATSGTGNYDLCDTTMHKFKRITISTTGHPTLATLASDAC